MVRKAKVPPKTADTAVDKCVFCGSENVYTVGGSAWKCGDCDGGGPGIRAIPPPSRNGAQLAVKKLDIACGQHKQPGFKGIDIAGDADITHDLNEFPWPIKTSSVTEAFCSHYAEHIPHYRPGWDRDGWWLFFDELYRVMKKDGTARFIHPYVKSDRAFWDPTHVRFIHEQTWYYLDKEWREREALDHYDVSCDFEVVSIDVLGVGDDYISRNQETQNFQRAHYWNVFHDLNVLLRKR